MRHWQPLLMLDSLWGQQWQGTSEILIQKGSSDNLARFPINDRIHGLMPGFRVAGMYA